MFRKTVLLVIVGISTALFFAHFVVNNAAGQQESNVEMSLSSNSAAIPSAEDNQPFPVYINVRVPQDQPVAGLDATLTYDKEKLAAIKVLPADHPAFANGYFGATAKVDTDPSCKSEKTNQAKRLECAIDQEAGIVSVTTLNLNANNYLEIDPIQWQTPPNPQVTGEFTLAIVIFQPQAVGPSGNISLDIGNNSTNAYSWVDLASDQDSQQVLSSQTPSPFSTNILNQTTCRGDLDRSAAIGLGDINILGQDYIKTQNNCQNNFCRGDIDLSGAIGLGDINILGQEYINTQNNCQP